MSEDLMLAVQEKAREWLHSNLEEKEKEEIKNLIENDEKALIEAFYKDLEFGTGGLRGIMGLGSNRINKYTIGMATQGLANYLIKQFPGEPVHVAIAYDSRINSRTFSETAAKILSANNIHVYLFDDLRPTPELSFAIRELSCKSGIVITASHNPKEYNGYKVYWEDGGQIIAPHDKNIIAEVQAIKSINEIKFNGNPEKIKSIGENIDQIYLNKIKSLSLSPDIIKKNKDLGIVFTPIHGTGVKLVPAALKQIGFENIYHVPEQDHPDGNFPTVHSPNPEENAALDMAIEKAKKEDADLVMATDPDGDRVGIAVKNKKGTFVLLNGNQIASLLIYYLLSQWSRKGMIKGKEYIVKTIVTTELLSEIAKDFNVEIHDVLTGFKYIADKIKTLEGQKHFIGGGEESYGYLIGDFVRDKDAVISCAFIAETAAWAKEQDKTLYELLLDIYQKYGLFVEDLVSVVKKGKAGEEEIREMMNKFRNTPPSTLAGSDVVLIHDYQKSKTVDMISDLRYDINLPKSNVLQFVTKDGAIISVRPSGTEPKIKFYFSVRGELNNTEDYLSERENRLKQIENIKKDLGI